MSANDIHILLSSQVSLLAVQVIVVVGVVTVVVVVVLFRLPGCCWRRVDRQGWMHVEAVRTVATPPN